MDKESAKGIPADFFVTGYWNGNLKGTIWEEKRQIEFSIEISNAGCILRPFGLKGTMGLVGRSNGCTTITPDVNAQPFFDSGILSFMFDVGDNPSPDVIAIVGVFAIEPIDNKVNLKDSNVEVNHIRRFNEQSGFSLKGTIRKNNYVVIYIENIILPNDEIKKRLEIFCDIIKKNIIVTSGTRKDNPKSQHFTGNAADIFAEGISMEDLATLALKSKLWNGIGYYPGKDKGGHYGPHIHVDLREGFLLWDDLGEDQSRGYYRYGDDSDFWRSKFR